MLKITKSAFDNIKDHACHYKDLAIRIAMMSNNCCGPRLKLHVDEIKENDYTLDHDGVKFVVDRELSTTCGPIEVDFKEEMSNCLCSGGCAGFSISGEKLSLTKGCSGSSKCKECVQER